MKNPLILSLLALAISSVGLGAVLLQSPAAPRVAEAVAPAQTSPALLARMDGILEENRALRERIAALELGRPEIAAPRSPVRAGVSREEFEAFQQEVRQALSRRTDSTEVSMASPDFEQKLATTLSEIRHKEAVEKVKNYHEERRQRIEDALPKIEEWLELTSHQTNEMRTALLAKYERDEELVRRWSEGEEDEVLGEQKESNREAHRNELALFLTEEQLETYMSRGGGK